MTELSMMQLLHILKDNQNNSKRYCFILGAGASRPSRIKTGLELAEDWLSEINEIYKNDDESKRNAMNHCNLKDEDIKLSSENYFNIFDLRFYPEYSNGSATIEEMMAEAKPSIGYYFLARHIAETENNLVITTNFDSLIEDSLFVYTDKKPIVVGHELLTDYVNLRAKRPVIAKIHRSMFFNPLNRKKDLTSLAESWKKVLVEVFKEFTPIVIGYAGGDRTLMSLLKDQGVALDRIYWCYRRERPSSDIVKMIEDRNGFLVPIIGFDEMMYMLGHLFDYGSPKERILSIGDERINQYEDAAAKFKEELNKVDAPSKAQEQIMTAISDENQRMLDRLNERIKKNPSDAKAYFERALLWGGMGMYDKALEDYNCGISLEPDIADWYIGRGGTYRLMERYRDALKDYNEAIRLTPNWRGLYKIRCDIYRKLGETEKAQRDFDEYERLSG